MKKIFGRKLLLLVLVNGLVNAGSIKDSVFVNRMLLSNSGMRAILNSISPGDDVEMITNKDDIILYYADIGIANPTKKKYGVEIICTDKKGNIVIQGAFKRMFDGLEDHVGEDVVKGTLITVTLDPKPGAMAPGQLIPLKNHTDYYIKLFVEKKLIGITKFNYGIE